MCLLTPPLHRNTVGGEQDLSHVTFHSILFFLTFGIFCWLSDIDISLLRCGSQKSACPLLWPKLQWWDVGLEQLTIVININWSWETKIVQCLVKNICFTGNFGCNFMQCRCLTTISTTQHAHSWDTGICLSNSHNWPFFLSIGSITLGFYSSLCFFRPILT